jgi:hypothetical protein
MMMKIPTGTRAIETVRSAAVKLLDVGGLNMAGEIALIVAAVCIALGIIVLLLTLRDR